MREHAVEDPNANRQHWWIVTGRICGQDEDTAYKIDAPTQEEAERIALRRLYEDADERDITDEEIERRTDEDDDDRAFVNETFDCGPHEPKHVGSQFGGVQ
jgi:hypothetical protein